MSVGGWPTIGRVLLGVWLIAGVVLGQSVETQVKTMVCDESRGITCGRCGELESTMRVDWIKEEYMLTFKCTDCLKGDPNDQTKIQSGKTTDLAPPILGMDFSGLCTTGISKFALTMILISLGFFVLVSTIIGFLFWRARKRRIQQEKLKLEQELEAKARADKKNKRLQEFNDALEKNDDPAPLLDETAQVENGDKKENTPQKKSLTKVAVNKSSDISLNSKKLSPSKSATSIDLQQELEKPNKQDEELEKSLSVDRSQLSANSLSPKKGSTTSKRAVARRQLGKAANNSTTKLGD